MTNLRGFIWTTPRKITEVLLSWEETGVGLIHRGRWRMVPACVWGTIWKERKSRCFEDVSSSLQRIKLNCFRLLCFWSNKSYIEDIASMMDTIVFC